MRGPEGTVAALPGVPATALAQVEDPLQAGLQVERLEAEPERIVVVRGESVPFRVRALDREGEEVGAVIRATAPRRSVRITPEGVAGLEVGEYRITATAALPPDAERDPVTLDIPVIVEWPGLAEVGVRHDPGALYAGTVLKHRASDRVNGLVLVDLSEPGRMRIAREYHDGLTGGVHKAFPTNDYVFALSGGERFLVVDVRDLENPRTVGEVRHGGWGGTPEEPGSVSPTGPPG